MVTRNNKLVLPVPLLVRIFRQYSVLYTPRTKYAHRYNLWNIFNLE